MYISHSELNERLKIGQQTRVAREALLLPYHGMPCEEVAERADVARVRHAVDETAAVDVLRDSVEREYWRDGGEYWHTI